MPIEEFRDSEAAQTAVFLAHLDGERRGQSLRDHLLNVSHASRRHADKIELGTAGATIGAVA
jgi:hypothetical protein